VRRTLAEAFPGRSGSFPGWRAIVEQYEAAESRGQFKEFALREMKLGARVDEFVGKVLGRSKEGPAVRGVDGRGGR
jgi:hypothetical protein